MRIIALLYLFILIGQSPALASTHPSTAVLSELTQLLQNALPESTKWSDPQFDPTSQKPLLSEPETAEQVGTTTISQTTSFQEVMQRIQDCQKANPDDEGKNLVAQKNDTPEFTTYAFTCRMPGNEIITSEVMVSHSGLKPEVLSYQELRFEESALDRDQLLRKMMLGEPMSFHSDTTASPAIHTLITLAKGGIPVALSFKAAKIISPNRTDWQKHYIAGVMISGATILTAEGILHFFNHRRGWGLSQTKINLLSSFAGLLSSIAAGAAKELVWDQRMGRGTPEFKDALYTAAGGASVSFTVAIPLEKLFGRLRRSIRSESHYAHNQ